MTTAFALLLAFPFVAVAILLVARLFLAHRRDRAELTRLRRSHLMYEAAQRLSGTLVIEEIYSGLRELTARAMSCDGMIVSSYDASAGMVRCVYLWVNGARLDHTTLPALPIQLEGNGGGMQTEVIRAGEGKLYADVHDRVRRGGKYFDVSGDGKVRDLSGPKARPAGARCALMVPVKLEGKVVGIVQAMSDTAGAYTPEHLSILQSLVAPMAVALQNAELYTLANHEIAERLRAEAALKNSEERLREADRRKDEFLATLAHELRNPLAPIRTAVALLGQDSVLRDKLPWCREILDRQVGHMAHLLDDLLDVSRISSGTLRLRQEPVALADVVRHGIEASAPLIEAGGHQLTVALPEEPVTLLADPTRLAQVISNLLNNAGRYSERGSRIELTAEREGTDVVVRVRDNGIGISAEMLPRIFEPFLQGDRSLERSQGGLGIGLTLVKQVVAMHRGRVQARSDGPGKGSEFTVRLPIHSIPAPASPPPVDRPARAEAPRRRILVVDDLKDSADSLAMMLEADGHEVRTAYDGAEGVKAALEFQADVVLLDIGMPNLNGYDAARMIRQQQGGREVALIAITGWGHEENRRLTKEAGFDLHLVKPVEPKVLRQALAAGRSAQTV